MDLTSSIIIEPFEVVINKETGNGKISLRNVTERDYAFKIKATHPTSYKVKPCIGTVYSHDEVVVEIEISKNTDMYQLHEHKFLFQFVETTHTLTGDSLRQLFSLKSVKKIEQKLNVRYSGPIFSPENSITKEPENNVVPFIAALFITYSTIILIRKIIFGF
ncbi:hypothetical protein NEMIN01_0973 [Nematocida minor]|uniref:uncharacterized protein n=1 Tax=Nematocida minor TaxID=1912983 RepID=UPI00221F3424|nr:uncharacterized protein NEMIN01_0973 [Nematocida minor]KAI5190274.1 hypothetical protein NEMIN01_0973 [Nematocida minor]